MHSKYFVRGFLSLSVAAFVAIPTGAFAEPSSTPDPADVSVAKPREAANQKVVNKKNELMRLQRVAKDVAANPNSTDEQIQAADDAVDAKEKEMYGAANDVKAGARKERKVVRDEKTIADDEAEIKKINATDTSGMSGEDVRALQDRNKVLVDDMARLKRRIGRKQKTYQGRVDETMWVHCKAPQVRNPVTNKCRDACSDTQVVYAVTGECESKCNADTEKRDEKTRLCEKNVVIPEIAELRKNAACYGAKSEKKIYSLFKKGESDVVLRDPGSVDTSSYADEKRVREFFEHQVGKLSKALIPNNRITNIETTSYASKVAYLPTKDKNGKVLRTASSDKLLALAHTRSKESVTNLYAQLGIGSADGLSTPPLAESWVRPTGLDYNEHILEQPKETVVIGPTWKAGEYDRLDKIKVPEGDAGDRMIIKAAADMIKLGVFSPVIAKAKKDSKDPNQVLNDTAKNLKLCCSSSQATLKFQPYQYTEMKVTIQEYDRTLTGCLPNSGKVADRVQSKPGETKIDDEDLSDEQKARIMGLQPPVQNSGDANK